MFGNQPGSLSGEPVNLGIEIFSPISSEAGSATLFFSQPLISGKFFASSAVIIGAEFILFIARRFFDVKSIPMLDLKNERTVQIPLSELRDFLRWVADGSDSSPNINPAIDGRNRLINSDGEFASAIGERGFPTPETPEAPIIVALYILANYADKPFSPYVLFTIPILTFPGVRGALPILILALLATIFIRAVVPPETTGSKPLTKPGAVIDNYNPPTFTPNDILQLFTRFGKHFGSK